MAVSKPVEIEVKLAVVGARAAREMLRTAGFRVRAVRAFERNLVLDDAKRALRRTGLLLRVRETRRGGRNHVLCTFKGPSQPGPHKVREEREFTAASAADCIAVFAGLGYAPAFRYEKYRTEYARKGEAGHVTLDETPIGVFLELEGTATWIDRTAKRLGFSRDAYITSSYYRLQEVWCAAVNRPLGDMVFEGPGLD